MPEPYPDRPQPLSARLQEPLRRAAARATWAAGACFAGLLLAGGALASSPGVVTIVEVEAGQASQASMLRGVARFQLAEGVALREDDIIEAGAQARLLRLEFGDGLSLSVGPASRVWIAPRLPGERGKAAPRFYLLQGWVKVEAPAGGTPHGAFATPALDAAGAIRAVVVAVSPEGAQVFAEAGEVRLQLPGGAGASTVPALKAGELWSRSGEAKAVLTPRPTPAFIQRVPKAFLDTLPPRAAIFKDREVAPKPLPTPVYAELQPWIDAEPVLRKAQLARWRPLAREPEFRKALVAGMAAHPEWDRVLFPEKYLPKPRLVEEPARSQPAVPPAKAPAPPPAPVPYQTSPPR